jgi:hypothetical protein
VRERWGREGDDPARAWEVGKGRGALMGRINSRWPNVAIQPSKSSST